MTTAWSRRWFDRLQPLTQHPATGHILIFSLSMAVLISTMARTIYNLDSAEFTTGARVLGIVHAPGYPLYLLIAHLFTYLPFGDVGTRVNLFSAISLAACAPILYDILVNLGYKRRVAFASTLIFMWSYYVWANGIVAEIYAPQLVTLAGTGWLLQRAFQLDTEHARRRWAYLTGVLYGLTLAMAPPSILFAPGVVLVYLRARIPWRTCVQAGQISGMAFLIWLIYFPIRAGADPILNLAGKYNSNGVFEMVNLQSVSGIWWMISGQQFERLFFSHGMLPTGKQLQEIANLFWGNYMGIGVILGGVGLYQWATTPRERPLLWLWLVLAVPFAYFYSTYGASDREMMLGPIYLVWTVAIARGLQYAVDHMRPARAWFLLAGIPLLFLAINYPLLDLTDDPTRPQAEAIIDDLPQDAVVFGMWWDVVPVQYLQKVEGQRPDLDLYNLFLFDRNPLTQFVISKTSCDQPPVVFLGDYVSKFLISPVFQISCQTSDRYDTELCVVQRDPCTYLEIPPATGP